MGASVVSLSVGDYGVSVSVTLYSQERTHSYKVKYKIFISDVLLLERKVNDT